MKTLKLCAKFKSAIKKVKATMEWEKHFTKSNI